MDDSGHGVTFKGTFERQVFLVDHSELFHVIVFLCMKVKSSEWR